MNTSPEGESPKSQLPFFGIGLALLFAAATFFSGVELGTRNVSQASLGSLFVEQVPHFPKFFEISLLFSF